MSHSRGTPAAKLVRADVAWAALVACGALAVYLRTLAPGLIPILDSPGFQFVGRVLGTLHNPGYPAYTLITWLWSFLPVGSLAYRINLFSAVCASAAVAGAFVLMRLLGVQRWIAVAAALGMAFGSIFWSQAVIAEVYALNAALVVWMLAATVAWNAAGRGWLLYAACALFAVGLGNHTTIVLFAPALAIYALMVNRGYVLRLRTIAGLSLIVVAGLSQYLFILVRTRMGAVYLDSQAATLGELGDVMRGAQFEGALFAFPLRAVLTERVALIVGNFTVAEMSLPVLACAVVGIGALLVRRRQEGILLLAGLLGQLIFVLNYDAGDIHVFTIPLLLLLWVLAAAGAAAIAERVSRLSIGGRAGVAAVPLLAAVAALPAWQLVRNFAERDLSDDTTAMRQFDALFAALPDDSFLVRENFVLDRMLMYKILGEDAGAGREIQAHHATPGGAASMHESGRRVFAFTETAHRYRYAGVNVRFSPFAVYEWTLEELLTGLPDGWVVGLAVPGAHAPAFHRVVGTALNAVVPALVTGREQGALAAVGIIGARDKGTLKLDTRSGVSVPLPTGLVRADALTAGIEIDGRERLNTGDGAVLALLTPERRLHSVRVLPADAGFRLRAGPGPFIPSRVLDLMPEHEIAHTWTTGGVGSGMWLLSLAAGGRVEVAAALRPGCHLRAVEKSSNALRISSPQSPDRLDGVEGRGPYAALVLTASEAAGAFVTAGCRTELFVRGVAGSASLREVGLAGMLDLPDRAAPTLLMARTTQSWLLGGGWSGVDDSDAGPFRWIQGGAATLLLPVEAPGASLRVQALLQGDGDLELTAALDGVPLSARRLEAGWHWYEWPLTRPQSQASPEVELSLRSADGLPATGRVGISQVEVLLR